MIRVADDDGVRRITIDRPDKANALSVRMLDQLADAVRDAGEARVLVISGAGRVFSAGADLAELPAIATAPQWEALSSLIAGFPGLSMAALNGPVAGGALGIALACDLRVAVETASAFYPVMRRGVLPQPSDPARLAALVGPGRARLMLLCGQRVTAAEALNWGLYERVVAEGDLAAAIHALADPALSAEPGHVRKVKALFGPR